MANKSAELVGQLSIYSTDPILGGHTLLIYPEICCSSVVFPLRSSCAKGTRSLEMIFDICQSLNQDMQQLRDAHALQCLHETYH